MRELFSEGENVDKISAHVIGNELVAAKEADEQSRQVVGHIIDANNCWLDFGQIGRLLVKRSSLALLGSV
ncbi:hypothetical protein MiYa_01906 [Microcystis aeruginosa NIES-2519]|uniref:Uncharacterized protein n=1 Tax=Microcystis aeruginosa NIES-2519 TaxID=2303981 RepID=A0A5A5R2I1_MICAE|nr:MULTISPECIES: hypothetical protein [Microcystis]AVQ71827.1 hypothetical protein B5D77_11400 [Microcystis sp. MC19]GCA70374.1 hypothetical protein MiYa_01906 [Microcystis aeruginosa NIES-2519]GCA83651.1 hypothetical protein MiHa_01616 [Microcystis aeruginosa NIES-2522]GCA87390.1 hypothetical protein MiTa_00716 [Microcystis aeruginosa NIES-4264]